MRLVPFPGASGWDKRLAAPTAGLIRRPERRSNWARRGDRFACSATTRWPRVIGRWHESSFGSAELSTQPMGAGPRDGLLARAGQVARSIVRCHEGRSDRGRGRHGPGDADVRDRRVARRPAARGHDRPRGRRGHRGDARRDARPDRAVHVEPGRRAGRAPGGRGRRRPGRGRDAAPDDGRRRRLSQGSRRAVDAGRRPTSSRSSAPTRRTTRTRTTRRAPASEARVPGEA